MRKENDGTYSVYADGEPVEGLLKKPQALALLLANWLQDSANQCEKRVRAKQAEAN